MLWAIHHLDIMNILRPVLCCLSINKSLLSDGVDIFLLRVNPLFSLSISSAGQLGDVTGMLVCSPGQRNLFANVKVAD